MRVCVKRESTRLERLNLADLSHTSVWLGELLVDGQIETRLSMLLVGHVAQSSNRYRHDNNKNNRKKNG